MNTIILLVSMIVIFTSYVSFIAIKYGVQASISQSYYVLPRKWQILFTLVTWGYAFPAIMIGVDYSGLAFLAGAGILFVGASPAFKEDLEGKVHGIGAVVGISASQALITFIFGQWWNTLTFIILSGITLLVPKFKKTSAWWIEVYAFIGIVLAYLIIMCK